MGPAVRIVGAGIRRPGTASTRKAQQRPFAVEQSKRYCHEANGATEPAGDAAFARTDPWAGTGGSEARIVPQNELRLSSEEDGRERFLIVRK